MEEYELEEVEADPCLCFDGPFYGMLFYLSDSPSTLNFRLFRNGIMWDGRYVRHSKNYHGTTSLDDATKYPLIQWKKNEEVPDIGLWRSRL